MQRRSLNHGMHNWMHQMHALWVNGSPNQWWEMPRVHWSWGLTDNNPPNCHTDVEHMQYNHRPCMVNTCQGRNPPQPRGWMTQQCMLMSSSFHWKPVQTGTNNTPLGCKVLCDTTPLTPHLSTGLCLYLYPTNINEPKRTTNPTYKHPPMNKANTTNHLCIWQQNMAKSSTVQHDVLASANPQKWDIIALQEPYLDSLRLTQANTHWNVIYPSNKNLENQNQVCSITLVNTNIQSTQIQQIKIQSNNITAIKIMTNTCTLLLFNVYNDNNHNY